MVSDHWSALLKETSRSKSRTPDSTVVFVGPRGCGKTALLRRFQGEPFADAPTAKATVHAQPRGGGSSGSGGSPTADDGQDPLFYAYFDAVDAYEPDAEREDSAARVSVWGCSEIEFEPLLATVLLPEGLSRTMVLLGLDLSAPWTFMETLGKWSMVMEKRIGALAQQLPQEEQKALKDALAARLQRAYAGVSSEEGAALPPLPEGILSVNLGIPVAVVCLKADLAQSDTFEARQRLLFAQQRVRHFCLRYGAALVYASAKDGRNCRELQQYLLHSLYPAIFRPPVLSGNGKAAGSGGGGGSGGNDTAASFAAAAAGHGEDARMGDTPFIPGGWDTPSLVSALLPPGTAPWKEGTPYEAVVKPPTSSRAAATAGSAAASGEALPPEQQWLAEMDKHVQADGGSVATKPARAAADGAAQGAGGGAAKAAASAGEAAAETTQGDLTSFFQGLLNSGGKK